MNKSKYYTGFTTLDIESETKELKVKGSLPEWLQGSLIRTTPARFEVRGHSYNHWFDGLAMLYAFTFSGAGGRVFYTGRFLAGKSYLEAIKKGRISRGEFATNPSGTLFGRVASFISGRLTDNCNVSVNKFGSAFVALTETSLAMVFDPATLETLGICDYGKGPGDKVSGQISIAHPHFDFACNCHYTFVMKMGRQSKYRFFSIDGQTGEQRILAEIPVKRPAYIHSIGMSKNFLVLAENPLTANPLKLLLRSKPFIRNYEWKDNCGVRFHVIDKETGNIVKLASSSPFFSFHHVNSFEKDSAVFVDVIVYPNAGVIDRLYLDKLRSENKTGVAGKLMRFRIDLRGGSVVRGEKLSDENIELPRINYRHSAGKPYRYVFGAGSRETGAGDFLDALVKIDLEKSTAKKWHREGCYPGEPVFVPSPKAVKEDDGIILSVVFDSSSGRSFLLVLNAFTWKETASVQLSHHIPFGFHGNFFSAFKGTGSFANLHR